MTHALSLPVLVALQQAAEPFTVEGSGAAWRGLFAVLIVLGLVSLLAWLVRRGHLPIGPRGAKSGLTIETAVPLGERRSLIVVAVEGRRLLLGLTPAQVSLVTELGAKSDGAFGAHLDRAQGRSATPEPQA